MGDMESEEEGGGGERPLRPADEFDLLRLKALNFATTLLSSTAFGRSISVSNFESNDVLELVVMGRTVSTF